MWTIHAIQMFMGAQDVTWHPFEIIIIILIIKRHEVLRCCRQYSLRNNHQTPLVMLLFRFCCEIDIQRL